MANDLYHRVINELKTNMENVWDLINTKQTGDMPPMYVTIPLEMIDKIASCAVIRTLQNVTELIDRFSEIPTLSRSEAARKMGKTPKTLREWEEKGYIKPTYIAGSPYYRNSDIMNFANKRNLQFKMGN